MITNFIKGLNFDDGTSHLIVVYGRDIYYLNGSTFTETGTNAGADTVDINMSKGTAIFTQQYKDAYGIESNATVSNGTNKLLDYHPKGTFNYTFSDRLFFGNCKVGDYFYRKRIFYTDIIEHDTPTDSYTTWDLSHGNNLNTVANSRYVNVVGGQFITKGIKIGDPFIILTGADAGQYAVEDVVSETQIFLDVELTTTAYNKSYIVGGNWFDVEDAVTGFGEHYGVFLAFERDRVWRWSTAVGKKPVIGGGGTTSRHSIISNHRKFTYWYHPTDGILEFDGNTAKTISDKIEPIMDGITTAMKTDVVGWPGVGKYKDHIYFYIGDVSFTANGESHSLTNAIIDFNTQRRKWKVHEFTAKIESATKYNEDGDDVVYLLTNLGIVLKFNDGNSDYDVTADDDSTLPIETRMITHPVYPSGVEVMNEFDKYYNWSDSGTGIKSRYKLHGDIDKDDTDWSDLNELKDKYGEVKIRQQNSRARGISFQISEISDDQSFEFLGFSIIYSVVGEAFKDEL